VSWTPQRITDGKSPALTLVSGQGVEELSEVKLARLEGDGRLTVIKRD
jgi:hypothetical protein